MDKDGYISNGELFQVLKMMVGSNLKDAQLQQIVDKTIIHADADGDGKISFEEFCHVSNRPRRAAKLMQDLDDLLSHISRGQLFRKLEKDKRETERKKILLLFLSARLIVCILSGDKYVSCRHFFLKLLVPGISIEFNQLINRTFQFIIRLLNSGSGNPVNH